MISPRASSDRPASRWAVSVLLAIVIHVVVIAAAWPFMRPLMLRAFGPRVPWNPPTDSAVDDSPIITGSISTAAPAVEEPDYASRPWDRATAVAPADARLPFSFARSLEVAGRDVIAAPPRRVIAASRLPTRNSPTVPNEIAPTKIAPARIAPGDRGPTIRP